MANAAGLLRKIRVLPLLPLLGTFMFYFLRMSLVVEESTSKLSVLSHHARSSVSKTKDPVLVLHIGPHKTGTTTIQCELSYFRRHLFSKASVAFLGRTNRCRRKEGSIPKFDIDCRGLIDMCFKYGLKSKQCQQTKAWAKLETTLRYMSEIKASVIISDEAFSRMPIRPRRGNDGVNFYHMLYSLFDKYYPGQVHVVMLYRRYHEWLLSKWNSGNKSSREGHLKPNFRDWPSKGGTMSKPKTFRAYYEEIQNYSKPIEKAGVGGLRYTELSKVNNMHPVEYLRTVWKNHSSQVKILNMHELTAQQKANDKDEDLVVSFVRQILPSPLAADTLKRLKREGVGKGVVDLKNPSVSSMSINGDLLNIRAYEGGLLSAKVDRIKAVKGTELFLKQYLKSNVSNSNNSTYFHTFPQICLDKLQYKDFLRDSVEFEDRMQVNSVLRGRNFNESFQSGQQQHKLTFWKAVQQGKFCSIDSDKFIEDNRVQ